MSGRLFGNPEPPVYRGSALTVRDRAARPTDLRDAARRLAVEAACVLCGVGMFFAIVFLVAIIGAGMGARAW